MNTRCKPGDLVAYVGDIEPLVGHVTTARTFHPCTCGKPGWVLDPPLRFGNNVVWVKKPFAHDDELKPLRGGPGQDETLNWAKVPSNKVPA